MKHLIFAQFKHSKHGNVRMIGAFLLIFLLVPLTMYLIQHFKSQAETDVTHYARGSYDLLLRPEQAIQDVEKETGLVPENYIGFGQGGITLKQWREVQQHGDVEVAAPVASLGYYAGLKNSFSYGNPKRSTSYTSQLFTSDGINDYEIGQALTCTLLENKKSKAVQQFEPVFTDNQLFNYCTEVANFPMPTTYHHVVAIDPASEERLTGISFAPLKEETPEIGWGDTYNSSFGFHSSVIPMLELQDSGYSLKVKSTVRGLTHGTEDTLALHDKHLPEEASELLGGYGTPAFEGILKDIEKIAIEKEQSFETSIGDIASPFYQLTSLVIEEDGKVRQFEEEKDRINGVTFIMSIMDMTFSTVYYTAGPLSYIKEGERFKITALDTAYNGVPVYREVKEHGVDMTTLAQSGQAPTFVLDPIGYFKVKEAKLQLSSSPLGIYQLAPAYLKKGNIELTPTIHPGSFITPSAKGVIRIQDSELIKGSAPIDAIRVRVAGIDGYTQLAANKIEGLADYFREQGFHVAMVAGASPQRMEVEVEGLGVVAESWTTLGAAGELITQWNFTGLLLSIVFLCVTAIYLVSRLLFWQVERQQDLILLQNIGWGVPQQYRLFRGEMLLTIGVSILASVPIAIGMYLWTKSDGFVFLWYFGVIVLVTILFLLGLKLQLTKLKKEVRVLSAQPRVFYSLSLTNKSIIFYRKYIMPPFIQTIFIGALIPFVYLALSQTVKETSKTMLGNYVNMQISDTTVLLLVGAIVLTAMTLYESLSSQLFIRRKEVSLLVDMGWHRKQIILLYLKEIGLWLFVAVGLGHLLGFFGYVVFYPVNSIALLTFILSLIGVFLLSLMTAMLMLIKIIKKYAN